MTEQRVSDDTLKCLADSRWYGDDATIAQVVAMRVAQELLERRAERCETCYFQARFSYHCPIRDAWEYFANDEVMLRPADSFACDRWEAKDPPQ